MEPIVDIATLGTIAGATAATTVVVQFVKVLAPDSWGTRIWRRLAALIAVAIIVTAAILTDGWAPVALVLAVLNGMIVGVASSALYDSGHKLAVRAGVVSTDG